MQGKNQTTRYGDLLVPSHFPDPDPAGVGQGLNEFSLIAGGGPQSFAALAVTTIFVDTPTIYVASRVKTIFIQTFGTITFTSGQVTIQLYAGRTQSAAVRTGALTQINTGGHADEGLVGTPFNFGPAATTTLANQGWWITPQEIPQLQWALGWVGIEFKFPSAPTQGSIAAAIYAQAA